MSPASEVPQSSSSDEPRPPGALRVIVLGDDPLARNGLAFLLAGESDLVVTAQVDSEWDLDPIADEADIALWDLGSDPVAGIDRMREWAEAAPPIVALLDEEDQVTAILAAGARAVLPRGVEAPRLAAALRAVAADLVVVDPAWADAALRAPALTQAPVDALTARELQVLQLVAEGLPNKLIADRLGISEHTAKFHVNSILAKLDAASRTEAVVKAARLGLIAI